MGRHFATRQPPLRRRRGRLAREADEERYRRLFEASLDANEAAAALFGVPRARLIGLSGGALQLDASPASAERRCR